VTRTYHFHVPKITLRHVLFGALVISGVLILGCAGLLFVMFGDDRVTNGGGYAKELAAWPHDLVKDFPKIIPKNATGVRMYAPSGMGPAHRFEIRFVVTPADAEAAIAAAKKAHSQPALEPGNADPYGAGFLKTIDDGDPSTPLPKGFRFFVLVEQTENFAYLAANPETGEMVYYASIH
jgi:hypothetical protein